MSDEQKFENCWADDDREITTLTIGGVEFRLRSITVGEQGRIYTEAGSVSDPANPPSVGRGYQVMLLTVGAALGIWTRFGREGWTDPSGRHKDITVDAIAALKEGIVSRLFNEHERCFRAYGSPRAEPAADAPVVLQTPDGQLVPVP